MYRFINCGSICVHRMGFKRWNIGSWLWPICFWDCATFHKSAMGHTFLYCCLSFEYGHPKYYCNRKIGFYSHYKDRRLLDYGDLDIADFHSFAFCFFKT